MKLPSNTKQIQIQIQIQKPIQIKIKINCFPPGWWEQIRWRGPITPCQETYSVTKQGEGAEKKRNKKEEEKKTQ